MVVVVVPDLTMVEEADQSAQVSDVEVTIAGSLEEADQSAQV